MTHLRVVSSRKPHRSAGVQLLRRDPDLRAEPELFTIDEPGRRVHEHRGGVDLTRETRRGVDRTGEDRLRWPEPKRAMWSIASSTESTTFTAIFSARNSVAKSSSVATRDAIGTEDLASGVVADELDAVQSLGATRFRNGAAIERCTSNVSIALHTDGRCNFAFRTISDAFGRFAVAST